MRRHFKKISRIAVVIFLIGCQGDDGVNSLVKVTNEPSGANCTNGGVKIETGIDNNSDGSLSKGEILNTSYVCNGVDGKSGLTSITTEQSGDNCVNGGIKIDSGVDTNGNGTLDVGEITATAYVCNGIDGNSLTRIENEPAGINCEYGGLKIYTGIDTDLDRKLGDDEITKTTYVCNGVIGSNSLSKITNEIAGANCADGGLKIDVGTDLNGNGNLDEAEIVATAYVCNATTENNGLVKVTNEPAGPNCANGGVKIDSGVDYDHDGILDSNEIQSTEFLCRDGDSEIRLYFNNAYWTSTVASWVLGPEYTYLKKFNLSNYSNIDNIIFMPTLRVQAGLNNKCQVRLYNVTDGIEIQNSEIETSERELVWVPTGNLIDYLPAYEIDLGIQMKSSNGSGYVQVDTPMLILYRHH